MGNKSTHSQEMLLWGSMLLIAFSGSVYAQVNNEILTVTPTVAMQGTMGQTVTFTLDTDNPPAPPAGVIQAVTIGGLSGASMARSDQYTVTAVFDIPADEAIGPKEATVTFLTKNGKTVIFSVADGFMVSSGADTPPSVIQQPQSRTLAEGSSATFTVVASGTAPLAYQWQKGDEDIDGAVDVSLTMDSIGYDDVGDYRCWISNDFGSSVSEFATLAITSTPPLEGYNLFCPMGSKETVLMDNDGDVVHRWASLYGPGLAFYFLEDGSLMRCANTRDTTFNVGGAGGRVEQYGWSGERLWAFDYSTETHRSHHDIEVLPNGNVLIIAWELKTQAEAIAAGRDPDLLEEGELWPDTIIEVQPTGATSGTIVWEWHVWDHLIQDYDATQANYGVVSDHPEKINLNYVQGRAIADWNHLNSVDYNAELDQIVLSVHNFGEIWIIDHSTTPDEAAGSIGGRYGQGGDLLYRWGNPQAYRRGTSNDQQLFVQHDAEWIAADLPGAGDILIFNNGQGRSGQDYSSVDQITPPVDANGFYSLEADLVYGPVAPTWTYTASLATDFYAERISGAQRLANGNTLICEGTTGHLFEVTTDGTKVWDYNYDGEIFRVERYSPDYSGFVGTELESVVTYPIVDTGQVECYDGSSPIATPASGDAYYGQDAQNHGHQPSYSLSDDGLTVMDNVTGLVWTQSPDLNGDGDIDANDKLLYTEALLYPETLNAQGYGGYDDWRLPTIKEIYSLMNFSGRDVSNYSEGETLDPFIDTNYFAFGYGDLSVGDRLIDAQFATSTLYVSTTMNGNETMFGLNLADGRIKGYPTRNKTYYLYLVRGNPDYGKNHFMDQGDGTVHDRATGLMWMQDDSGSGLNWQEALAWAQAMNDSVYLGYTDWRVPDVKELQGLLDYTRSPETSASAAIDPVFHASIIINEAGEDDYPCYWSSTTHLNYSRNPGKNAAYVIFGRALGYMNTAWIDVHGAGSQRSDPKSGDPADYPTGHGPQGDAVRIYNHVRLVRDMP